MFYAHPNTGEQAQQWADSLGLTPVAAGPGEVRFRGVVDGRVIGLWAVMDHELWTAAMKAETARMRAETARLLEENSD